VKIDTLFFQQGFIKSKSDPNICIKRDGNGNVVLISLYVYYLIIEISAIKLNDEIKRKLSPGFEMKDIGQMHYYLGIEVWMEDGYSESDWERDPNHRKSTTGYAFNIGSRIVSWSNKKQPIIYLSSIETKYKALCSSTCEAI
jgi:hypothetical protein